MNGRLFLAGILMSVPLSTMAMPIEGEIFLSGNLQPHCSGGGACDFDNADGLNFGDSGGNNSYDEGGLNGDTLVTFASGDFANDGLGFGDTGEISDFLFDPLSPDPVDPLWTLTGDNYDWSFTLETVAIGFRDANNLNLSGTGFLHSTDPNLDSTFGLWSFSTDSSGGGMFSWSSTNVASEPGILLVFGVGLFGLIAARRFRR